MNVIVNMWVCGCGLVGVCVGMLVGGGVCVWACVWGGCFCECDHGYMWVWVCGYVGV